MVIATHIGENGTGLVPRNVPEGVSLVDALIEARRDEAGGV